MDACLFRTETFGQKDVEHDQSAESSLYSTSADVAPFSPQNVNVCDILVIRRDDSA